MSDTRAKFKRQFERLQHSLPVALAEAQDQLIEQLGAIAGSSAQEVAGTVLRNAREQPDIGSLAGLWSTLLLFIGATTVFARLQGTLNLIFHTSGQTLGGIVAFLRKRVFSFGVVFALGFLVIVSTVLAAVIEWVFAGVPSLLPLMGIVISLAIYAFAFALLYHYLPDRRVRWQQAFLGGLITAALFMLGRWAIGVYMARAAPGSAYGSMGTLVILLVWMYYAAMVFFVGALITAVIDERAQIRCGEMPPEHEDCWPEDAARRGEQAEPQVYPTTLAVEPGARPPVASPPDRTP